MLDWLKNILKIIFILFFDLGEEFWSLGLGSQFFTLCNDVLHLLKNDDFHYHLFTVDNEICPSSSKKTTYSFTTLITFEKQDLEKENTEPIQVLLSTCIG
jgi:hypothetical protein